MTVLPPNPDTDYLIEQMKRFESLATSSQTFNDDDLIAFLNAELQSVLVPIIQSVNEEYGVMVVDYPMSSIPPSIRIPSQATGARLRNVQYMTQQGYITTFPRLDPDKLSFMSANWSAGFYVRNNEIVFYPQPPVSTSGTLRLTYFRRPNELVSTTESGRAIDIDYLGNTVTLDTSPTGLYWVPGGTVDIIIGTSPFDFRTIAATIVDIAGSVIQLAPEVVAELEVGDYVALHGQSPVPQFVPLEAMQLLAQLGGARCLQSLGDTEGYKVAQAKIADMTNALKNLIADRIEGQPKKLVGRGMSRRGGWNLSLIGGR